MSHHSDYLRLLNPYIPAIFCIPYNFLRFPLTPSNSGLVMLVSLRQVYQGASRRATLIFPCDSKCSPRSQQHQHFLTACQKWRISHSIPDLLNQHQHLRKISGNISSPKVNNLHAPETEQPYGSPRWEKLRSRMAEPLVFEHNSYAHRVPELLFLKGRSPTFGLEEH